MAERRHFRYLLLALIALGTAGCEAWYNKVPSPDDLWYRIPWFDHMIAQRSVHPYETAAVPRNTPAGAVPITGGEADWSTEFLSGNATTADRLANPWAGGAQPQQTASGPEVPNIPASFEARGDTLYGTFCAVCHGFAADGKGSVGPRVGAPSLLTERARGFSDGYLYSIIRYGRGVMPRYGDKIYRVDDRWAVVSYLRTLQAAAPAPAPAVAAGASQ